MKNSPPKAERQKKRPIEAVYVLLFRFLNELAEIDPFYEKISDDLPKKIRLSFDGFLSMAEEIIFKQVMEWKKGLLGKKSIPHNTPSEIIPFFSLILLAKLLTEDRTYNAIILLSETFPLLESVKRGLRFKRYGDLADKVSPEDFERMIPPELTSFMSAYGAKVSQKARATKGNKLKQRNDKIVEIAKATSEWGKISRKKMAEKVYGLYQDPRKPSVNVIEDRLKESNYPTKRTGRKKSKI